ncbi:hypothetical protein QJS10_CPB12g00866 [Acorus calamus]|uniref:Response regulatory domain-containing protein n=1 Tax=Acorus calamus TaxID=4465 RepID=A0AAV9DKQ3_ACOCL|nr:hypothetical protein QJS10_CPB12g00866 [Acorus calamus]
MRLKFDEAESGEDAIKYFEERNEYDLVFVSKELPGMNGFQRITNVQEGLKERRSFA